MNNDTPAFPISRHDLYELVILFAAVHSRPDNLGHVGDMAEWVKELTAAMVKEPA